MTNSTPYIDVDDIAQIENTANWEKEQENDIDIDIMKFSSMEYYTLQNQLLISRRLDQQNHLLLKIGMILSRIANQQEQRNSWEFSSGSTHNNT